MAFEPSPLAPELLVTSLAKSLPFYQALGFAEIFGRPEEGFLYLGMGKAQLMLLEKRPHHWWLQAEPQKPFGCGINFQTLVTNIKSIRAKMPGEGRLIADVEVKTYFAEGKNISFHEMMVEDPDGYLFRLQEPIE